MTPSAPGVDMANVNTPQDVERFRSFSTAQLKALGLSGMRKILRAVGEPVEAETTNVQNELSNRIRNYFRTHRHPPA